MTKRSSKKGREVVSEPEQVTTQVASVVGSNPLLLIVFVISLVVALAIVVHEPSSNSARGGNWYRMIWSREILKLYPKLSGFDRMNDSYLMMLRAHYQYALVEGRKELAEYLKSELDKEAKKKDNSSEQNVT